MHGRGPLAIRLSGGALTLAALAGCTGPPPMQLAPQIGVRFLAAAPRRCLPSADIAPSDEAVARLCAEEFVLQNGYTGRRAPRDTALLVREPFEVGSWDLLVERRRYLIEPKAREAVCDAGSCVVFFSRLRAPARCVAVVMTSWYQDVFIGRPDPTLLYRSNGSRRCLP
jgi:hypothetical protein